MIPPGSGNGARAAIGLVVGKFCPLHKGHEALIDFARSHCEQLVILSYAKPELPGCSAERRAAWLEALFPEAWRLVIDDASLADLASSRGEPPRLLPPDDAPDAVHHMFIAWVCRELIGVEVDRVFSSEAYGDGFAAGLQRIFARPVDHLPFDPPRHRVPISGRRLRERPDLHRTFLSEPVRRSLVRRIGLIGGESTGKTSLAAASAERLGTCWVPEYGREFWERSAGKLAFADMLTIAQEQVAREERLLAAAEGWLVCDTTPLVTASYSDALFGRIDPELAALAARPYDHLFLCAADFPFVQDGTRRDAAFRQAQDHWYRRSLAEKCVDFTLLSGSISQRLDAMAEQLGVRQAGLLADANGRGEIPD